MSAQIDGPATKPVTLDDAKRRLRVDGADHDAEISLLVDAAIAVLDGAQGILGRALVSQVWADVLTAFPSVSELPVALMPVVDVTAVKYYDVANVERTLPAESYNLIKSFRGGYLQLAHGYTWPATRDRDDAVTVEYRAGYGESATDVPADIRLAVLELVAHWFENPEAVLAGASAAKTPMGFEFKLRRYIRPHF